MLHRLTFSPLSSLRATLSLCVLPSTAAVGAPCYDRLVRSELGCAACGAGTRPVRCVECPRVSLSAWLRVCPGMGAGMLPSTCYPRPHNSTGSAHAHTPMAPLPRRSRSKPLSDQHSNLPPLSHNSVHLSSRGVRALRNSPSFTQRGF